MEAFFVIVMIALVLGVGVLALLGARRTAVLRSESHRGVQDSEE